MNNKKLFAILTLVCFMFTLMPVAAFAADLDADQVYVKEAGEWVKDADATTKLAFEVGVGNGTEATTENFLFYVLNEDGNGVALDKAGKVTIGVEGEYEVYAIDIKDYVGSEALNAVLGSIDTVANKVAKLTSWARGLGLIVDNCATVTVDDADAKYVLKLDATDNKISIPADGGWNATKGNVTATLEATGDYKALVSVKAKELTFTTIGNVDLTFEDGKVTDKNGKVDFRVTAKQSGSATVIVSYGDAKAVLDVTVETGKLANVAVNAEPTAAKNIKGIADTGIEFKFTDANGAAYTSALSTTEGSEDYKITVVSQPADAKVKATNFELKADDKAKAGVYDLYVKDAAKVKKEGTYTVKVTLANTKVAEASFTVAEQGDVVAIKFAEAPKTVALDDKAADLIGAKKVITVDAKGVVGVPDYTNGKVEYSVVGKAVKSFDASKGLAVITDDEDYIGSKITVYAVYNIAGKTFMTSNEIVVADAVSGIEYKSTTAKVAVNTALYANFVDANGNKIELAAATPQAIVLDKPEGAIVFAKASYDAATKGIKLELLANMAGEYEIQTIATYDDNRYLSTVDTFVVEGGEGVAFDDVVVVSIGADKMIVNDEVVVLDVPAYIENNRTMLQFNVLGYFGFDVNWIPETTQVVAEGNGIKVVMTLNSKVATVNGEEVVLDVAPTSINNRTVVPVGFLTGTFGLTPNFIYGDAGLDSILFTK